MYATDKLGKTTCLTPESGTHDATFSTNMRYFMDVYSRLGQPPVTTLRNAAGHTEKTLIDNRDLSERMEQIGTKTGVFHLRTGRWYEVERLDAEATRF